MEFFASTEGDLARVADYIIEHAEQTPIVLFRGDLGAGKTTLIKCIGEKLGISDEMSSPSFGIVNEYLAGEDEVYHVDLYRINDISEIYEFGLPEVLDSGKMCFIEWPEMAEEIWQEYDCLTVSISIIEDDKRRIFVKA
jgi:tRNA threonylcarbamoyladenosine biosynthesis protein TsaE